MKYFSLSALEILDVRGQCPASEKDCQGLQRKKHKIHQTVMEITLTEMGPLLLFIWSTNIPHTKDPQPFQNSQRFHLFVILANKPVYSHYLVFF